MAYLPGFVGGSNVLSSDLENCERSINWRPEVKTIGHAKNQDGYLLRTPGLRFAGSIGDGPVSVLFEINNRMFGVSGTVFFEMDSSETITTRGTVTFLNNQNPATMCSSGSASDQILIVSG